MRPLREDGTRVQDAQARHMAFPCEDVGLSQTLRPHRQNEVARMKRLAFLIATLALLLWLWPNLIHEPLHWTALQLQGSHGSIHFDWGWPAQPYIERTAAVSGVLGGLLFLLLPSIVSVAILLLIFRARSKATLLHISLATYLSFDLIINVLKHRLPQSDFHFLIALPLFAPILLASTVVFVSWCTIPTLTRWYNEKETSISNC